MKLFHDLEIRISESIERIRIRLEIEESRSLYIICCQNLENISTYGYLTSNKL